MSIHKSLKLRSSLVRARNVWTRVERLEALAKAGKYSEGDSVYGLPKVRTAMKAKKLPKKAKKEEAAADTKAAAPAGKAKAG